MSQHPLIIGLFSELPAPGSVWPADDQARWFRACGAIFDLIYPESIESETRIDVTPPPALTDSAAYQAGWNAACTGIRSCIADVWHTDGECAEGLLEIPEQCAQPAPALAVEQPVPAPQIEARPAPAAPATEQDTPRPPTPTPQGVESGHGVDVAVAKPAPQQKPKSETVHQPSSPTIAAREPFLSASSRKILDYFVALADRGAKLPHSKSAAAVAAGVPAGSLTASYRQLETEGCLKLLYDAGKGWGVRLKDGRELWPGGPDDHDGDGDSAPPDDAREAKEGPAEPDAERGHASRPWTPEEDEQFRAWWADGATVAELAMALDRTEKAITRRRADLGLPGRLPGGATGMVWTPERDDILRQMWADGATAAAIHERLGISTEAGILARAGDLGLPGRQGQRLTAKAEVGQKPAPPERLPRGKKAEPDDSGLVPVTGKAWELYEYLRDLATNAATLPPSRLAAVRDAGLATGVAQYAFTTLEDRGWLKLLEVGERWGVRLHSGEELWSPPKAAATSEPGGGRSDNADDEPKIGPAPPARRYSPPEFANGKRADPTSGAFETPVQRRCEGCQTIFSCTNMHDRFCTECSRFVVNANKGAAAGART